jgi:hypothetical protein
MKIIPKKGTRDPLLPMSLLENFIMPLKGTSSEKSLWN